MTTILRDGHASNVSATTVGSREDLFEVVQQEQEWSRVLQLIADKLRDGAVGDLLDFERARESGHHQVGVSDGRQADKLNTAREPVCNRRGDSHRQAGFSGTPRTRDAQQPNVSLGVASLWLPPLVVPAQ